MTHSNGLKIFKKLIDVCFRLSSKFLITDTDYIDDGKKQKLFYKNIENVLDYAKSKGLTICLDIHGPWCCNGKTAASIVKKISRPN